MSAQHDAAVERFVGDVKAVVAEVDGMVHRVLEEWLELRLERFVRELLEADAANDSGEQETGAQGGET